MIAVVSARCVCCWASYFSKKYRANLRQMILKIKTKKTILPQEDMRVF